MNQLTALYRAGRICLDLIAFSGSRQRLRVVLAIAVSVVVVALSAAVPIVLKHLIDGISHPPESFSILSIAMAYGLVWISSEILLRVQAVLSARALEGIKSEIVVRYQAMLFDSSSRSSASSVGAHLERMRQLEGAAVQFLDGVVWQVFPLILRIGLSFSAVLVGVGLSYAVLLILTMLIFLYILLATHDVVGQRQKNTNTVAQAATKRIADIIKNIDVVKIFGTETQELEGLRSSVNARGNASVGSLATTQFVSGAQILVLGIGLTVITAVSALGVQSGQVSIGEFVQLNAYMLQFVMPASFFAYVITAIQRSSVTLEQHGRGLIGNTSPVRATKQSTSDLSTAPKIQFVDVDITPIGSETPILKNLSLTIPGGAMTAVVGASGAGKSTLLRAILGLESCTAGRIEIAGSSLDDWNLSGLRRATGFVTQGTALFERSLSENIEYGAGAEHQVDIDSLIRATRLTKIVEALPDGVSTLMDGGGSRLSEGERQRVLFARAIAKRPKLLLLDEPTSSLDAHTEQEITRLVCTGFPGTTRVVVAHRLQSVMSAELIIVMHEGRCAESGTHRNLIAAGGLYANMWRAQMESGLADHLELPSEAVQ